MGLQVFSTVHVAIPPPLKRGFEATLTPLVTRLIAWRVTPNAITTAGTLVLVSGGFAFGYGSAHLGGALLLASGIFDMLDGRVARATGGVTAFGAFYDSTLDRIAESALFMGIAFYFMNGGLPADWRTIGVATALVALAAGLVVSYTRARAEGLGLECKVGLAQRAERILGIGVPSVFVGAGPDGFVLLSIVALVAVVAVITVAQRIAHVRRLTRALEQQAGEARRNRLTKPRRMTTEAAE